MKKVLIVSRWFPPLNMIASKRFGQMCKYFESYGYESYVLTMKPQRLNICNFTMDLEVPIEEEYITRIGRMGTDYMPKSLYANFLINFFERQHIYLNSLSASVLGRYEKYVDAIGSLELKEVDIIIGTYPEMDSLFIAKYLSKKYKCPYIVDIRDLVEFTDRVPIGYKKNLCIERAVERYVFKKAAAIVPVTKGYKKVLEKRYPRKKIEVIYNGWDGQDNINLEFMQDEKYLYYAGSLYEHRLESLVVLLKCLKEINRHNNIKLVIRSTGPKEYDKRMKRIIKNEGVQNYVHILESADGNTVKKEQNSAYINVVLSTIHEDDKALIPTVPGKLYELLNTVSPVLAIVPNCSDIAKILHETNKGIATIKKEEIINFVLQECEKYSGNMRVEFYSRKMQAKRYCKLMDEILRKH